MTWYDGSSEAETLDLVREQHDERQQLLARLAAIQQAIDRSDRLISAYRLALAGYGARYGLGDPDAPDAADPSGGVSPQDRPPLGRRARGDSRDA
jgi:hypothetical protein